MKRLGKINGKDLIIRKEGKKASKIFVYYLDSQKIGVCDPKVTEDNIIFLQNTKENVLSNEIRDQIEKIVNTPEMEKYLIKDEKYKEEKITELAHVLNEEKNDIKKVEEVELDQKIDDKEQDKEESKDKEFRKEQENKAKDLNIKQELDLSNKVTDMKTLGGLLQKEGKIPTDKEYTKLAVVESDRINDFKDKDGKYIKGNSTRYQFVLIAKDGTFYPIDLEQDSKEGNNPLEENITVKSDGSVKENSVLSRYKIGDGSFAIDNEKYGEIKVYYSPRKTLGGNGIEGNKSLDIELETSNVWETDKDERDLAGEYNTGYRSVEEAYEEAKKHDIEECKTKTEDVDGDKNTKSHIDINDKTIEKIANKLLENDIISNVYNKEDIKEKLRNLEDKEINSVEEFKEIEKNIEEEAENEKVPEPNSNNY